MTVEAVVDIEWALREWLRAHPTKDAGTKVWLGTPNGTPTFPYIEIVGRIGGTVDDYADVESPRISFAVWGGPGGSGHENAVLAMQWLVRALKGLAGETLLSEETYGYGASDFTILRADDKSDPSNKLARYIVDATITVRSE